MVDGGESVGMLAIAARLNARRHGEQKQVLRSAYPNVVGAPSCSAQDDTKINKAKVASLKPCPFKAALFRIC